MVEDGHFRRYQQSGIGTYNVTVTGSNGCATTSATIINDNTSFTITGITTDSTHPA
ncbi:MAG: hypothetical protein IPN89_18560 [Saprospiraceae bacterium]|nr:hypothetical protein [Saprospiraceae bacterium]